MQTSYGPSSADWQRARSRVFAAVASATALLLACVPGDRDHSTSAGQTGAGSHGGGDEGGSGDTGSEGEPRYDVAGGDLPGGGDGGLPTTCDQAIARRSYIGCEYWGATLSNPELNVYAPEFTYALAVANDTGHNAELNVSDGAAVDNDYIVPANDMIVIEDLPWKESLRLPGPSALGLKYTRKVPNAGYHITSTRPVTVYQFNPLRYQGANGHSMTNDASLLLPAHIYRDEYVIVTRQSMKMGSEQVSGDPSNTPSGNNRPGFLAVVGPADGAVSVEVTFSAHTRPSDGGSNEAYAAHAPGQTLTTTVAPHEVLQILSEAEPLATCSDKKPCGNSECCNTPRDYDLTGTTVRVVSGPMPAVFAGHSLAFIPWDTWAADHLEQQMFPLETWGTRYLAGHNITQVPSEPTVWKVVSGSADNQITFDPPSVHSAVTLDRGDFVEFESLDDFEVRGEKRTALVQFMVGQNYTSDTSPPQNGDPAMALGVPVEQYRKRYTFLAPPTYVQNYLTVLHERGDVPRLDGAPISGDTVDITTTHERTNLEITAGIHKMESDFPFAITVYGVGSYTSYMYPGGLDLNEVIVPEG